jgi:transcriptional regulator with XRE-family HTH domain
MGSQRAILPLAAMSRSVFPDAYGVLIRTLIDARQSAGLRQVDLAERLGKQQSFVSKFERGERRLDAVEFLIVARALGADGLSLLRTVAANLPKDAKI